MSFAAIFKSSEAAVDDRSKTEIYERYRGPPDNNHHI
jgi:hypothetical protein